MNQLGKQEAKILAYTLAVKKLEAQIVTFQKQQLCLNEQLTFQANEIYVKDEKLKRHRRIGMKAVKEKEQLKKIVDSWKDSSKNLWKLVDLGMTSNNKVGLGYEIKSNNEVLSYEEEMNRSVFKCTEEDYITKPLYSRFTKTNSYKGVPHPLTRDYTPKPQEEIDDSFYIYGKKGPQKPEISDSDDNSNKHSTYQSNDSEGSCRNTSEHSFESESESKSVSNGMSASNLSYLIKDYDYYEKKMAREAEFKKQRLFNTGNRVVKPVWTNANGVNHANHFVPRPVYLNAGRPNINSVRPNINTGRTNVNSVRPRVNTGNSNVNTVRSRQPGNWGTAVKTSAGYNWRNSRPNSNYDSGLTFIRTDHPLKNMEDRGIFNSRCSGHMTGNKDHLDDFDECKGGSVTFGGSKGYITIKGTLAVTTHAGISKVTNSAAKVGTRKPSTNSKKEECLTEFQNLQTQEKEAFSTSISEDTPEILDFKRDLDQLAQKHLKEVTTNKATSTNLVNSGSEPANTQHADQDDSDMPELTIFNKPRKGIFDEASYDKEGMVHDFNNLPTKVAVSPIPTLRIHNIHPQSQILGNPKSSVQTRSRVKQTSGAHALVKEPKKVISDSSTKSRLELKLCKRIFNYSLGHAIATGSGLLVDLHYKIGDWNLKWEVGLDYDEIFSPVARIEVIECEIAINPKMGKDQRLAIDISEEADEVACTLYTDSDVRSSRQRLPKRLKSDEVKDDEPTKKSGKRRKQMQRKGLHTDLDKDDSEGYVKIWMDGQEDELEKENIRYPAKICKSYVEKKHQGGTPNEDCSIPNMLKMMEKQADPGAKALGKDFSNPFLLTPPGLSDENRLKLYDLSANIVYYCWTDDKLLKKFEE
ncbi:hypothetical protein Tco_1229517 [Tanacetum coccineum]